MKTILVLTDLSQSASNAANYAASLSRQLGTSDIILYHSYEPVPVAPEIPVPEYSLANAREESNEHLIKLKSQLQPLVNSSATIRILSDERPLVRAMNEITETYQVELAVMGATGKSNLEQIFIGSNTIMITRESSVPLLIVPKETLFAAIRKVVFACDLKDVAKTIPPEAVKKIVQALGARLFILNVDHNEQDHVNLDIIDEQTSLHAFFDSENPEYHYTDDKDITEGIMKFAAEQDIQLAITIPKKRGFFESLFHGSLTKKLTLNSHIPVLLVRKMPADTNHQVDE